MFLLNAKQQKTIDDVSLKTDYSTLHVTTREFEIKVTPIYLGEDTAGRQYAASPTPHQQAPPIVVASLLSA